MNLGLLIQMYLNLKKMFKLISLNSKMIDLEFNLVSQLVLYTYNLSNKHKEELLKELETYDEDNNIRDIINSYIDSVKNLESYLIAKKSMIKRAIFIVDTIEELKSLKR